MAMPVIYEELKNAASLRRIFELEEKVHYAGLMHDVGKMSRLVRIEVE